mmetsp:Transcript_15483/g.21367  ORF Transcript_15483/g.21367 Transcript_15483/m.21367 type:complete len:591 (+) Transcript_15483:80-1852(+)|eukprot:CAMPEP_0196582874 /NCGR_PEP_ID=MMETSP1081-20130531/41079_1 /TAXON_ID=36882 /ORGANISM="Pyramimonas amylifera, Strain CCMP720" /LENGTH=590 /DNA_ID=CAMNT_0041903589 /DNA_START=77 /DNA_END=1849 /DNA_ORIENTATION=+
MADQLAVEVKETKPFDGQKPGTSGLRKKTKLFMQTNYLENFVQSTFNALLEAQAPVEGGTIVVSGDGRFHNSTAVQTIVKMAVAHKVRRVWIGSNGLLSTPAVSAVIRERGGGFQAFGGFILTASHNPGGIDEDFGIKYNCENGGPAPEKLTDAIFQHTTSLTQIRIASQFPDIDIDTLGRTQVGDVEVEVFDCTEDHLSLLFGRCFDRDKIARLIQRPDFSMKLDSLHGVQGVYAQKVFVEMLGAPASCLMNSVPREDFGGPSSASHGHADPNLRNAAEVCSLMGINPDGSVNPSVESCPSFGCAWDGDADRNMILGDRFFCTPSDSLAVIVFYAARAMPFFQDGLKGVARSMPTSCALDLVAKKLGVPCFEVPTGWKFFGNLMDSSAVFSGPDYTPFICGEESFGTGSNHVREKDGMWAVLAWLSILAFRNPDPAQPLVGVGQVVREFWEEFGRNHYVRYDYEGVDKGKAEALMARMASGAALEETEDLHGFTVATADVFEYTDPVDGSVSENQGVRYIFTDGSRIVFRLSGTGVEGATIRLYLEKYEPKEGLLDQFAPDVVKSLAELALSLSKMEELTGRDQPSVIT